MCFPVFFFSKKCDCAIDCQKKISFFFEIVRLRLSKKKFRAPRGAIAIVKNFFRAPRGAIAIVKNLSFFFSGFACDRLFEKNEVFFAIN